MEDKEKSKGSNEYTNEIKRFFSKNQILFRNLAFCPTANTRNTSVNVPFSLLISCKTPRIVKDAFGVKMEDKGRKKKKRRVQGRNKTFLLKKIEFLFAT